MRELLDSHAAHAKFAVRIHFCPLQDLDRSAISAWADLEQRALEPNAYLSPSFVLPAARHLDQHKQLMICMLKANSVATRDLAGLGVFEVVRASRRFPLPHLRAYRSRHSYLGGFLLDRENGRSAAEALFQELRSGRSPWHGLEISGRLGVKHGVDSLAQAAANTGATWHEFWQVRRAALLPSQAGEAYLRAHLSRGRAKDLRRRWRRLADRGPVRWRVLAGPEISAQCIDRFLDLEHRSWKAAQGTSLRAQPQDERFFREMIEQFAACGRAVFTELWAGNHLVASTSNLISGSGAFAFKLGWDPGFQSVAPGYLNEVELIRHAPSVFGGLEFVDSGAAEGSFLDELWAERRTLVGGAYATSTLSSGLLQLLNGGRQLVRWLRRGVNNLRARSALSEPAQGGVSGLDLGAPDEALQTPSDKP